jgi:hypothetical protein
MPRRLSSLKPQLGTHSPETDSPSIEPECLQFYSSFGPLGFHYVDVERLQHCKRRKVDDFSH